MGTGALMSETLEVIPPCILDVLELVDANLQQLGPSLLVDGSRVRDMLLDIRIAATWAPTEDRAGE